MVRTLNRTLFGLLIAAVVAFGADNSIGTWKLNVEKSTYTPAPFPLKNLSNTREAVAGGVKATISGERADGTQINASYEAKYGGPSAAVTGSGTPYDTIAVKQVNANTFTYHAKKTDGKYNAIGRVVVSDDGKTMTQTAKGTDADGKPLAVKLVYEKQ